MKHGIPSQRQLRVGEQVRHALSETLQRGKFHDEILIDSGSITINEVRMTPDLKNAKAYVSSLLLENRADEYLEALNDAASYFQKELNRKLDIKFTPRVRFVHDESIEEVNKLEALLDSLPKSADQ